MKDAALSTGYSDCVDFSVLLLIIGLKLKCGNRSKASAAQNLLVNMVV